MRTFKNTWFARFAKKEGISDDELRRVVNQLEAEEWDADLGGHVYKQRIARDGEGGQKPMAFVLEFAAQTPHH